MEKALNAQPQLGASYKEAASEGDREAFFAQLEAIGERANVDPEEAEALADEAVRVVRSEQAAIRAARRRDGQAQ
jgi:hypothetical protein